MELYHNTSKLPVNHNAMIRPRIDELLAYAVQNPTVVVTGGAGFGKTQAVAGFLAHSDYYGVWQQLTVLDNYPMRFWESFVYTISLHKKELGKKLEALGFPDSLYQFHEFLHLIAKELYADNRPIAFVYDDFHMIQEPTVLRFFQYLVSANLENVCLIFITRRLEACYFSRRLFVINADDLRFTKQEIEQYFVMQQVEGIDERVLDSIYNYTGGWPMAMYLILPQMKSQNRWDEQDIVGSQQMLFTLIENENFSLYREAEQLLFIRISLLTFFPFELVMQIGAYFNVDARQLLGDCAFVNYDAKAHKFYFHQLFLDYLSEKHDLVTAEEREKVLFMAGAWCREHKYYVDAINYFDKCGKQEEIWELIRQMEGRRRSQEEAELFVRYIEKFPDAFMNQHVLCRIIYGALLLNNLRILEAQKQIKIAFETLNEREESSENRQLRGEASIVAGFISLVLENTGFVEWFRQADALLPNGSSRWGRQLRLVEYTHALNLTGVEAGALETSIQAFFEGIPYVSRVLHGAGYGIEYLAAAEGDFLTGKLKEAEQNAYKAFYMANEKEQYDISDNALFVLLRTYMISGNIEMITDILGRLEKCSDFNQEGSRAVADIARGWFYSEIGNVSMVEAWILEDDSHSMIPISVDKEALLHTRCLLEQKHFFEALALLDKLEAIMVRRNSLLPRAYVEVYRGIAYYQLDQMERAQHAFEAAYQLTVGNQLIMPFIEYGHETRALLARLLKEKKTVIPEEWLRMVYTKAATYTKRHSYLVSKFKQENLTGQKNFGLTGRELELLRNLSQGLTRDEIAESMYISPHTVKSMLKTVYSKIGAINSADAVRIVTVSQLI